MCSSMLQLKEHERDSLGQNLTTDFFRFICIVRIVNLKLSCQLASSANQNKNKFHVYELYKSGKSTKNRSSNFGFIEENMDLSCSLLAVLEVRLLLVVCGQMNYDSDLPWTILKTIGRAQLISKQNY